MPESSVISLIRKGRATDDILLVVCHFTQVPRPNYRTDAPRGGYWTELLNSDAAIYGGNGGRVEATPVPPWTNSFGDLHLAYSFCHLPQTFPVTIVTSSQR